MKLAIPKDQDANKSDDATDGAKISEQPEGDAKAADGEQTKTSKDAEPAEIKKGEDVNVKEKNEASAAATESRDSEDVKGKAGGAAGGDKLVVEEIGAEDGGNLKTDVGKVGESEEQSHPRQEDNATVNRENINSFPYMPGDRLETEAQHNNNNNNNTGGDGLPSVLRYEPVVEGSGLERHTLAEPQTLNPQTLFDTSDCP
ncbi:hypothetical protein EOD39_5255 [Acipenser ruthenus]|uniref:Uncharacterized protein n=1 Tax=Acipenser ruthenus TaxID=7906 RepID=A0A444UET9_ACIRT|nr:hypothetical protein EOD39_5255 [Acipenser ruthenus]